MTIAILSWGSLIWEPQQLPLSSEWKTGGPLLPIEFSRISDNRKLTLVIDPVHGVICPTWFAFSPRESLAAAIEDLRLREGTVPEYIGYVDIERQQTSLSTHPQQVDITDKVQQWCHSYQIPIAIWTALTSNFRSRLGVDFSLEAAIDYLKHLPAADQQSSLAYIHNTPTEIDTPLRRSVAAEWQERISN
jgi:hypothetical protein